MKPVCWGPPDICPETREAYMLRAPLDICPGSGTCEACMLRVTDTCPETCEACILWAPEICPETCEACILRAPDIHMSGHLWSLYIKGSWYTYVRKPVKPVCWGPLTRAKPCLNPRIQFHFHTRLAYELLTLKLLNIWRRRIREKLEKLGEELKNKK